MHVVTENRTDAPPQERVESGLHVFRTEPPRLGRLWRWAPLVHIHWWYRRLKQHPPQGMIWASNTVAACGAILAGHRDKLIYNPPGCCAAMREIGRLYPHVSSMQLSRLIERLDRFAYHRAAHVVVSSNNVKQQFECFVGPRQDVNVIPLATEMPTCLPKRAAVRRRWGIDLETFVIGYIGRLDPCKGLDFLFDAIQQAGINPGSNPRFVPNSKLLIVGDGPDEGRLRRRAQQMGIDDRIIWAGRMTDPAPAYAAMDALVLPSLYEAFGLVLLEAMAAGVPVLARRGNGRTVMTASGEIVDHGRAGLLFDAHDPGDLARRLRDFEANPMQRHAMGTTARFQAHQHTWDRYVQRCLPLLGVELPEENADERYRRAA